MTVVSESPITANMFHAKAKEKLMRATHYSIRKRRQNQEPASLHGSNNKATRYNFGLQLGKIPNDFANSEKIQRISKLKPFFLQVKKRPPSTTIRS